MKILLVEDEDLSRDDTILVLRLVDKNADVVVSMDRDSAIRRLVEEEFDLVICDLRIPADPAGSSDEAHGLAVHAMARRVCPGTPLVFLTGYSTNKNVKNQLSSGGVGEFYGRDAEPLVQLAIKDGSGEEAEIVRSMVDGLTALGSCTVSCSGEPTELMVRAVQMYGRRLGANAAELVLMSGLSGAEVGRAVFTLPTGQSRHILVKLQGFEQAKAEIASYEEHVPNILPNGYFAPLVTPALHGLRKDAALYYTLLANRRTFFDICAQDPSSAARIVDRMAESHLSWTAETFTSRSTIREVRRRKLPDVHPAFNALDAADWVEKFEDVEVDFEHCTIHGDLHGENVLVDGSLIPTLIDYADVANGIAALDPLTLELSLFFHEHGPGVGAEWRTVDRLSTWRDVDVFADGLKFEPIIRACRSWAASIASDDAIYATAYSHAVRQLKYPDVPNDLALALAKSAAGHFLSD